jgi:hypothetical protein
MELWELGKRQQRRNTFFSTAHHRYLMPTWLKTDDITLDHLTEVTARFRHIKVIFSSVSTIPLETNHKVHPTHKNWVFKFHLLNKEIHVMGDFFTLPHLLNHIFIPYFYTLNYNPMLFTLLLKLLQVSTGNSLNLDSITRNLTSIFNVWLLTAFKLYPLSSYHAYIRTKW